MKNKLVISLLISTLVFGAVPVYATEPDEEVTEEAEEPTESANPLSVAESLRKEVEDMAGVEGEEDGLPSVPEEGHEEDEELLAEPLGVTSNEYAYEGDATDGDIIEATNTANSEVNNCQVTVKAKFPEGFDANCFAVLLNKDTNVRYNYPLYEKNGYSQRGYLPDGSYSVMDAAVYEDDTGIFEFNKVEDFTLTYGSMKTIELSLADEQKAVDLIAERTMVATSEAEREYNKQFTVSDHEVQHTGSGTGHVAVQGIPSRAYIMVIKVTKGGLPGEMEIAVSTDNGETFADPEGVDLDGRYSFDNMIYYFEVPETKNDNGTVTKGSFAEGDTYRVVYFDPAEDFEYTNSSDVSFVMRDENPEKNPFLTAKEIGLETISFRIDKGGPAGKAIYVYSLNGSAWSEQMYIPEDFKVHIPDTTLYADFTSDINNFEEGNIFTAAIPKEHIDPLYIMVVFLAAVLAGGYFAIWYFFKSKIVPQSVYTIHEYEPVKKNVRAPKKESTDVKDKKKKRRGKK